MMFISYPCHIYGMMTTNYPETTTCAYIEINTVVSSPDRGFGRVDKVIDCMVFNTI